MRTKAETLRMLRAQLGKLARDLAAVEAAPADTAAWMGRRHRLRDRVRMVEDIIAMVDRR